MHPIAQSTQVQTAKALGDHKSVQLELNWGAKNYLQIGILNLKGWQI